MCSERKKIVFITTSRADFGLMSPIIKVMSCSKVFDVELIVSGSHLLASRGDTINEVTILGEMSMLKVPLLEGCDTGLDVARMVSDAVNRFASAYDKIKPSIVFVLGDRAEVFAAAQAAVYLRIPIAHYFGGDSAAGTYDNLFRHCITKLSSLHFVSSEESLRRVLQLGEPESRVFNVGSTAVENIRLNVNGDANFLEKLGISRRSNLFLVTFHPLTMGDYDASLELEELISALVSISSNREITVVFTSANTDEGGDKINKRIQSFVATKSDYYFFPSLGMQTYLNLMSRSTVVIGNSSSGIYEAPILGIPSVDIGERQRGRFPLLRSVVRASARRVEIIECVERAMAMEKKSIKHCFGRGNSSREIASVIERLVDLQDLARKEFVDKIYSEC